MKRIQPFNMNLFNLKIENFQQFDTKKNFLSRYWKLYFRIQSRVCLARMKSYKILNKTIDITNYKFIFLFYCFSSSVLLKSPFKQT